MVSLIVFIVSIVSLAVLTVIVFRKIPLLLELPETAPFQLNWKEWLVKVRDVLPVGNFSFEIFLQKILSKIRVLTLKTDNKTSNWLQRLRKRSQKKKFDEEDNYWQEIKNYTKK